MTLEDGSLCWTTKRYNKDRNFQGKEEVNTVVGGVGGSEDQTVKEAVEKKIKLKSNNVFHILFSFPTWVFSDDINIVATI